MDGYSADDIKNCKMTQKIVKIALLKESWDLITIISEGPFLSASKDTAESEWWAINDVFQKGVALNKKK